MGDRFRRIWYTIFPFLIAVALGAVLFLVSKATIGDLKSILLSISAAFFALPILYFGYQIFSSFSKNEMQRDVFEYFKAQIDTIIMTLAKHYGSLLNVQEEQGGRRLLNILCEMELTGIKVQLETQNSILGFHLFRTFPEDEKALDALFRSYAMANAFTTRQRVSLVRLTQALVAYRVTIREMEKMSRPLKRDPRLAVTTSAEGGDRNDGLPDRHLLLRKLSKDQHVVVTFGDFPAYLTEKLTTFFTVDTEALTPLSHAVLGVLSGTKSWLEATGNEILLRPDQFRFRRRSAE